MRFKSGLALVAAGVLSIALAQSCGGVGVGTGSGDTAAPKDQTQPGPADTPKKTESPADVAKAFTVAIEGASADVGANALPAGAKMAIAAAATPPQFGVLGDKAAQASAATALTATDANGKPLTELLAPMSVGLVAVTTGSLFAVEKTDANLCVLTVASDGRLLVWRRGNFVSYDPATKAVRINTFYLGTYQLFFCGNEELKGFLDVTQPGKVAAAAKVAVPDGKASCDGHTSTDEGKQNSCMLYSGKLFNDADIHADQKAECEADGSTFHEGPCPAEGLIGVCALNNATNTEYAIHYYAFQNILEEIFRKNCEKSSTSKWYAGTTYEPTPDDDQAESDGIPTPDGSDSGSASMELPAQEFAACDRIATSHACDLYVGRNYANPQTADNCAASGKFIPTAGCPKEGALGYCVEKGQTADELAVLNYQGGPNTDAAAAKGECQQQGAGYRWFALEDYVPTPADLQNDAGSGSGDGGVAHTASAVLNGWTTFGGCLDAMAGICTEYTGEDFAGGNVRALCAGGTTFSPTGCPDAGVSGICQFFTPSSVSYVYYAPTVSSSNGSALCTAVSGSFEPRN